MQDKLKVYIRQKQIYRDNDLTKPIVVTCVDCLPVYTDGTVPMTIWKDVTEFTEGLDELKLSWSAITTDNSSNLSSSAGKNEIGSNYSKGVTLDVRFIGAAFEYIFNWMMAEPCQIMNSVEVMLTDTDCNQSYRLFEVKVDNITYAPFDAPCIISTNLREADAAIKAVETTIIEDDWQHWFNSDGLGTKDHPAFIYVVEKKPQFIAAVMVAVAYMVGMLSMGGLIALTVGKRWIRKLLGLSYFCPSPYISTYIDNFCQKFGFTRNTIFDTGQPYHNTCQFFPVEQYNENHDGYDSPSTKFIWDNRTGMPVNVFLDKLKDVFAAEWYITPNNELVFQKRSYFENLSPVYDFTASGAVPLYNFVYKFNGNKKPSYGHYEWMIDPQDTCSNDLKWRYNAIVDFDQLTFNPMLEGAMKKNFDFACTSFQYDGSTEDWMKNAIKDAQTIASVAIAAGLIALLTAASPWLVLAIAAAVALGYNITNNFINDFFDRDEIRGAVRTSSNVINIPRLLLKDAATSDIRAKVVHVTDPVISSFYNQDAKTYYELHPAFNTDDPNYFGNEVTEIYNYPLYVDEDFKNNLFDRFHEQDNPLKNPVINQDWQADIDLCCSMLDLLGVWSDNFIKIGNVVVLENRNGRMIKGRINQIEVNYKSGMIHLEGNVLGCI